MLHLRPPFKGADVADDKSLQIYNLFWILTIYFHCSVSDEVFVYLRAKKKKKKQKI